MHKDRRAKVEPRAGYLQQWDKHIKLNKSNLYAASLKAEAYSRSQFQIVLCRTGHFNPFTKSQKAKKIPRSIVGIAEYQCKPTEWRLGKSYYGAELISKLKLLKLFYDYSMIMLYFTH